MNALFVVRCSYIVALTLAACAARPSVNRVVVYDVVDRAFLRDTCAGGATTPDIEQATYYPSAAAAAAAIRAAELDSTPLKILELH